MKRLLIIISLHLFLFLLIFSYQAQAADKDEWYVEEFDTYIVTAVNGEISHGDFL